MTVPAAFFEKRPSSGDGSFVDNSDTNRANNMLISGGRVGKCKGIVGGIAPCEAGLVLSFESLSVVSAAAFTSLLIWSSPSLAGSCDPAGPETWSCSGAATGSDPSAVIFSSAPVTVVTQPGFGLSTSGRPSESRRSEGSP